METIFWKIIYNIIFIPLGIIFYYYKVITNPKDQKAHSARKKCFETLAEFKKSNTTPVIYFHSSSVGEFEQAKPIIELIKKKKQYSIVCSFFSYSGYEYGLKYQSADCIFMIPLDTRFNMDKMIRAINPVKVLFMRYDLWPNLVWLCKTRNIPMYILNGTVREKSLRINSKPLISFFRSYHNCITKIFTISDNDKERYSKIFNGEIKTVGDTRYDIVYSKAAAANFDEKFFSYFESRTFKILTAGSTYLDEEKILIAGAKKISDSYSDFKMILIPHELEEARLIELEKMCLENSISFCRYTKLKNIDEYASSSIIILDIRGILYKIYKLADIAYVGGGFHGSIHNIMEPAVFKKFIIFGPHHRNSFEALEFLKYNAAKNFNSAAELIDIVKEFYSNTDSEYHKMAERSYDIVKKNLGAGEKLFNRLFN